MTTPYHAKLFAYELSRRHPSNDPDAMITALFDAAVDLNPHQVEAALFAVRSPIQQGCLLADEVGLGKTIEAGLILCQHWAERKRKLLVICPAALRQQWAQELDEKFHLPSLILDARSFAALEAEGYSSLASGRQVILTSYHFAYRLGAYIEAIPWDLVVIDEAHKLRNCYRTSNSMGQGLLKCLAKRRKLLLTATPFQNTLLELYGLATLIDPMLFGDVDAFRSQYAGPNGDLAKLREQLKGVCVRTLRRQVQEYVRYTNRIPITQSFEPSAFEQRLYESVTAYLQRDDTFGLPGRQRHLTALVLCKLLASSTSAVRGTLQVIQERLRHQLNQEHVSLPPGLDPQLIQALLDDDIDTDLIESLLEETSDPSSTEAPESIAETVKRRQAIQGEISTLQGLIDGAGTITVDAKTTALLTALDRGFTELRRMGAADKALIFTESRRTQDYLIAFLEANGYRGQVLAFNGGGGGAAGAAIYQAWLVRHTGTDRVTGSRAVDQRTALIDHFRDSARILVATEAAAEGVNLQFCSLVINYDLPWNPQRIEQRIGRCHRYGQRFDVVVVNFLNAKNHADQRVLDLLTEKFQLFHGMFGASDEVLGSVESGLDFEARISAILRTCRSTADIDAAFATLQAELDDQIHARLDAAKRSLIENFDEDVHARLKLRHEQTAVTLDALTRRLWTLTKLALADRAAFDDAGLCFSLRQSPPTESAVPTGSYGLGRAASAQAQHQFRLSSVLGSWVLNWGKAQPTPEMSLVFDSSHHPTRIALVEALRGHSGWISIDAMAITGFAEEDHLILSGVRADGSSIDSESCGKIFNLAASVVPAPTMPDTIRQRLHAESNLRRQSTITRAAENDRSHFQEARDQLERWAEAQVAGLEREIDATKNRLKCLRRDASRAETVDDQLRLQQDQSACEADLRRLRRDLFTREDEVAAKRDELIAGLQRRLSATTSVHHLFTIHFAVT